MQIFFCERNVHNLHLRISKNNQWGIPHTACYWTKYIFCFLWVIDHISKERKSWQWRKVLETLLFSGSWVYHVSAAFTHLGNGCLYSRPAFLTVLLSHWIRPLGEITVRKLSWGPLSCSSGTQHFALAWAMLQACHAHPHPWPGQSELAWLWVLSASAVLSPSSHQAVADLGCPHQLCFSSGSGWLIRFLITKWSLKMESLPTRKHN